MEENSGFFCGKNLMKLASFTSSVWRQPLWVLSLWLGPVYPSMKIKVTSTDQFPMIELRWIFVGSLWAASLPKMGQTFRGCLVLFLLFQDLVTASIALEPGGLNYDLDQTQARTLKDTFPFTQLRVMQSHTPLPIKWRRRNRAPLLWGRMTIGKKNIFLISQYSTSQPTQQTITPNKNRQLTNTQ